jgi:hypothetical protein
MAWALLAGCGKQSTLGGSLSSNGSNGAGNLKQNRADYLSAVYAAGRFFVSFDGYFFDDKPFTIISDKEEVKQLAKENSVSCLESLPQGKDAFLEGEFLQEYDGKTVIRVKTDGTDMKTVKEISQKPVSMFVENGKIFYSVSDGKSIYTISLNDFKMSEVSIDVKNLDDHMIGIQGNWAYLYENSGDKIFRYNFETKKQKR